MFAGARNSKGVGRVVICCPVPYSVSSSSLAWPESPEKGNQGGLQVSPMGFLAFQPLCHGRSFPTYYGWSESRGWGAAVLGAQLDCGQLFTCIHIEAEALCHVPCRIGEGSWRRPRRGGTCLALAQFTGRADWCGHGGRGETVGADGGGGHQE